MKPRLRSPIKRYAVERTESGQQALGIVRQAFDTLVLGSADDGKTRRLLQVMAWVEAALEDLPLSVAGTGELIQGLPSDLMQRLFRQACQRGIGHELSRRQRSVWVKPFNQVTDVLNKHLAVKQECVVNYNRAPRSLAIASRQNAFIPPSTYDRLVGELESDIFSETPAPTRVWFMRSVLVLALRIGITFEGALRQLCRLRVGDVRGDHVVVAIDPKRSRWIRVWLDPVSRVTLQSLLAHHARRSGANGVRKRTLKPLAPLMNLATGSEAEPDEKTLKQLRADISAYLAELCKRANLPTYTLQQLLPTVRWVLAERGMYSTAVIDYLAGQIATNVMPLDDLDADWSAEPVLPSAPNHFPKRTGVSTPRTRRRRKFDTETSRHYNAKARVLRDVFVGRGNTAEDRAAIRGALQQLVQQWMQETEQTDEGRNFMLLAAWLETQVAHKRIKTLIAYLGDGLALIRYAGDSLINELGKEDVDDITEPGNTRHLTVWQLWRAYLREMKVPLAPLGKLHVHKKRQTEEERLLPPAAVADLLTQLDGDAQLAAALGYFVLARIEEVLDLRLCDLALLGAEPYLEIREGKGGKSRRVYLTHAPSEFIAWLRDAQTALFRATDPHLLMVVRLGEPLISLDKSRLEKLCRRAMAAIGRSGCTFHDLRKSRATALVLRGMDVRLVSRWLGHATVNVSWLSYLRTLDVAQRQAVKRIVDTRELNLRQVAALLDVQSTSYLASKFGQGLLNLGMLIDLLN